MLTELTLREGARTIARNIKASLEPYSEGQIEAAIVNTFITLVRAAPEEMKTLQDRAESAEVKANRLEGKNAKLVARNELLEAANRVITQQIESVKAAA